MHEAAKFIKRPLVYLQVIAQVRHVARRADTKSVYQTAGSATVFQIVRTLQTNSIAMKMNGKQLNGDVMLGCIL